MDIRYLPDAQYQQPQKKVLTALFQVLPVLCAHLRVVFREHNQVDFSEISLKAMTALDTTRCDLVQLDYKIQHLLVDEFQDTSPSQIELLKL